MARALGQITSAHRYAPREVVSDPKGPYFGVEINDRSLTPGEGVRIAATHFRRLAEPRPKSETEKINISNSTYENSPLLSPSHERPHRCDTVYLRCPSGRGSRSG